MKEEKAVIDQKTPRKKHDNAANSSKAFFSDSANNTDDEIADSGSGFDNSPEFIASDGGGWNTEDDRLLAEKVRTIAKANDKVSFKARLKQFNWKAVAFKNYSPKDCENRFNAHLKDVRRCRNLNEIATDIEANIKQKSKLKKPCNSYQLFIIDQMSGNSCKGDFTEKMKNMGQLYGSLPVEEKLAYQHKAKLLLQEYLSKKDDSASNYMSESLILDDTESTFQETKTPFMLYVDRQNSGKDYAELRKEYANLSIDEQYELIMEATENLAQEKIEQILSKDELRLYKGQIKQPLNAYNLYVKDMIDEIKEKSNSPANAFSQIAILWKNLDADKKKTYTDAAAVLKMEASKEQNEFKKRHGLQISAPKRTKSMQNATEPAAETHSKEENTVAGKKRKLSEPNEPDDGEPPKKQVTIRRKAQFKLPKTTPPKSKKAIPEQTPSNETNNDDDVDNFENANTMMISDVNNDDNQNFKMEKISDSQSELSDANDRIESEAASSSTSVNGANTKKSSKAEKKSKKIQNVEPPGEKPPSNLFDYFAKHIHTGKPRKAQKAFDKLTKHERKRISIDYNEKVEAYVAHLKKYLASLPKEDAMAYIQKVKDAEVPQNDACEENDSQEY